MKRYVKAAKSAQVTLEVCCDIYDRYSVHPLQTFRVSGKDLLDALRNMCDEMQLYLSSEEIDEEGMKPKQIIDEIESCNGDGCDYIYYIKDVATGKVLLDGGEPEGYEDEEFDD